MLPRAAIPSRVCCSAITREIAHSCDGPLLGPGDWDGLGACDGVVLGNNAALIPLFDQRCMRGAQPQRRASCTKGSIRSHRHQRQQANPPALPRPSMAYLASTCEPMRRQAAWTLDPAVQRAALDAVEHCQPADVTACAKCNCAPARSPRQRRWLRRRAADACLAAQPPSDRIIAQHPHAGSPRRRAGAGRTAGSAADPPP